MLTHVPYKPWCRICVMNKAKNDPHTQVNHRRDRAEHGLYVFESPEGSSNKVPVLVITERMTKGVWAVVVERKGASEMISNNT